MGRKSRSSKKMHSIEKLCGTTYTNLVAAAGSAGSLALQPSQTGWGRATTMAEIFQLYRFTKLAISYLGQNTQVNDVAVGVMTGLPDTIPVSVSSVCQLEYSSINFGDQTTPTTLRVPRSFLVGQAPNVWWKTVSGAPQDWNEIQGVIYGVSGAASANAFPVFIEYEIEFCDFVNPLQTPKTRYICVDEELGLYRSAKDLKAPDGTETPQEGIAPGTPVVRLRSTAQRAVEAPSVRKG
jgi:hypothetical protein